MTLDLSTPAARLRAVRIAAGFHTATKLCAALPVPMEGATYRTHERSTNFAHHVGMYVDFFRGCDPGLRDLTADWLLSGVGHPPLALREENNGQRAISAHDALLLDVYVAVAHLLPSDDDEVCRQRAMAITAAIEALPTHRPGLRYTVEDLRPLVQIFSAHP